MSRLRRAPRNSRARFADKLLDPEQEAAATVGLSAWLPREQAQIVRNTRVSLVSGVPGSGKTLIAMYRFHLLASPEWHAAPLFLCHNTPLAAMISAALRKELPRAKVNVRTFSSWALRQYSALGDGLRLVQPTDQTKLVKLLRQEVPIPDRITIGHLISEFDFIDEHLIRSEQAYEHTSRAGRVFSLRVEERTRVWQFYARYREELVRRGLVTHSGVVRRLCFEQSPTSIQKVDHIIIDEAQFFSPARFLLIKRALRTGGQLFLASDPDQGFLEHRASWKSVGLSVVGRARRLSRSYRTTREILAAARLVLPVATGGDDRDRVAPDFSQMNGGARPYVIPTASPQDSVERLVNEIAALIDRGCAPGDLLTMYGEQIDKVRLYEQLVARLGKDQVWWMNYVGQKLAPPSTTGTPPLRLANVKTATGLEARYVFLLGVEALIASPDPSEKHDPERLREDVSNKRLLYMAMTRAAERLVILTAEDIPSSWAPAFEIEQPLQKPMGALPS